jgi:catechol 2,3-dioxygenase-like lactoylglutathione lyase family enzyme
MSLAIEAIHHVGLVVKDLKRAEEFYIGFLGLKRHYQRSNWLILNSTSTLHLIPLADAKAIEPKHHAYRHVALQVSDLRAVLHILPASRPRLFQADLLGQERDVVSRDDTLDFGVGSLFVRDPDGNLIEFLQMGHGIFPAAGSNAGELH